MTSLTSLSDKELAVALHEFAAGERTNTIEILVHLTEFEKRDLYLRFGYPSMFEYCTRGLGYSESSAIRRLKTARLARRFPQVYRALERKELTVVTASMLAPVVTRDNVNGLLEAARGKLQREVKGIVVALRPSTVIIPDRVIPMAVPAPTPEVWSMIKPGAGGATEMATGGGSLESGVDGRPKETGAAGCADPNWQESYRHNGGKNPSTLDGAVTGPNTTAGSAQEGRPAADVNPGRSSVGAHPIGPPPIEKRFKFEFGASKEFMKKFSRVQSLMSNKIPVRMTFEVLFESLMDDYLERNDPVKRSQRREARRVKTEALQSDANDGVAKPDTDDEAPQVGTNPGASRKKSRDRNSRPEANPASTRHIPASVRDNVYTRDGGCCTFVSPSGVRCNSTRNLQIDHVKPFALGGGNDAPNLRLLCAKHNLLRAKYTFGETHKPAHHCRE
jgi:5-methylcytosine-specific restriction endonuclease McrA